jgi:hypothetical protein
MLQQYRKRGGSVASNVRRRRQATRMRIAAAAEWLEPRVMLSASVLSYHNDAASVGQNLQETVLTPSNVKSSTFGKLFTASVQGQVYAQPLFMPGLTIAGGVHNVLFVATEHDSIYALDADTGRIFWHDNMLTAAVSGLPGATSITTIPSADAYVNAAQDIQPEIGITSTPVIAPSTNTLYVTASTKEMASGVAHYVQQLFALDVATGASKFRTVNGQRTNVPETLGDTTFVHGVYTNKTPIFVNGTGSGNDGKGHVNFNVLRELQRASLTLANGQLYMGWGSYGDVQPYHGWIAAFNPATLALTGVLNTTPNGEGAGVWMGGGKLSSDSQGNLYLETGDGTFDGDNSSGTVTGLNSAGFPVKGDFGDSFLKIATDTVHNSPSNQNVDGWGLKVVDYFTPFNQAFLDAHNRDLGSGAPLLLPDSAGNAAHPHLLVGASKQGVIYLLDRDNLGKFSASLTAETSRIVEETATSALPGGGWGTPAYFNQQIYYVPGRATPGVKARAFSLPNGSAQFSQTPASTSPDTYTFPGSTPSVSANGKTAGIIWDIDRSTSQLRAYRATGYNHELYTSAQAANGRDALGTAVKFTVPTVVNGHVYVGTTNSIVGYGLLNAPVAAAQVNSTQGKSGSPAALTGTGSPNTLSDPPMPDTLAPIAEALNQSFVAGSGMPIVLDNFSTRPTIRTPIEPGDASELHGPPSLLDLPWVDRGVDADPARRFDWLSPV